MEFAWCSESAREQLPRFAVCALSETAPASATTTSNTGECKLEQRKKAHVRIAVWLNVEVVELTDREQSVLPGVEVVVV